jgi:hypothetical protein
MASNSIFDCFGNYGPTLLRGKHSLLPSILSLPLSLSSVMSVARGVRERMILAALAVHPLPVV